mgnify:CR=1 FL=1
MTCWRCGAALNPTRAVMAWIVIRAGHNRVALGRGCLDVLEGRKKPARAFRRDAIFGGFARRPPGSEGTGT